MTMLGWVAFTLLAGAAVSSVVVTGCFLMGFTDEWKQVKRKQQAKELAAMEYQTIYDMFWNDHLMAGYPRALIRDEYHRRRKEKEERERDAREDARQYGLMTLNEMRTMMWHDPTVTVQVNQASDDSTITAVQSNVVGNGNVVALGSNNAVLYADGEPYLTVSETYETEERR